MIVFDLLCARGHRFEGWFASAAEFESQRQRQILECPSCSAKKVERVPSASRVNLGATPPPGVSKSPQAPQKAPQMEGRDPFAIAQVLYSRMVDELLAKTEDVGKDFPAEVRRIFYEEAAARAIRGQATEQQHQELLDEGIPVTRLPLPPAGRLN